ncbi:hypothetical protein PRUPE_1G209500 [Prunus persica]|uniref:Uncharacterized protein n=1 Tax=Prunus persica TaxID=3760 RepID=A0A251R0U2_PRUPE|nr:hypothetical protein PRUPE_1G209500 [Prunus persica]
MGTCCQQVNTEKKKKEKKKRRRGEPAVEEITEQKKSATSIAIEDALVNWMLLGFSFASDLEPKEANSLIVLCVL